MFFQNDVQGVLALQDFIEKRACDLAVYIIENRTTIRSAARQFGISKSTVHTVLSISVGCVGCLSILPYNRMIAQNHRITCTSRDAMVLSTYIAHVLSKS